MKRAAKDTPAANPIVELVDKMKFFALMAREAS